jgi:signal transduction histidine kinase
VSMSLRGRLLLGAALWTLGLFAVAGVVLTFLIYHQPRAPVIFHAPFRHTPGAILLSILLLAAGLWHVRRGLKPLNHLRRRLADVHAGRTTRVEGSYPSEVQPLVDDLNALLQHQADTVRRAVSKAGDLAHGLKTPLAVLAHEGERLAAAGEPQLSAAIGEQVERMRRQIDHHLAHARAAASGATPGARCSVHESATALVRTLERLHAGRGIAIHLDIPDDHTVRAGREDLDEMLGNLLDNACKWAATRVLVRAHASGDDTVIEVEDDGAGLPQSMRESVLQRGVRADEAAPGSGLGLSIVRDLAEIYGGSIALEASPAGGLRARLRLPAAL